MDFRDSCTGVAGALAQTGSDARERMPVIGSSRTAAVGVVGQRWSSGMRCRGHWDRRRDAVIESRHGPSPAPRPLVDPSAGWAGPFTGPRPGL